jgi:hypothetical protein
MEEGRLRLRKTIVRLGTNPIQTQTARLAPVYDYNQRTTGTSVSISGDGGTIAVGAPDDFGMAFAATYVSTGSRVGRYVRNGEPSATALYTVWQLGRVE